ncbi:MAG TPA: PilN domain-containing protein [Longimicrobiales bacterium]
MIEVNLLPGASKRSARKKTSRGPGLFARLGNVQGLDRWTALIVGGWIIGPGLIAWLFLGASRRIDELNRGVEQAVQDSTRYAKLIEAQERLLAREDSIKQKLAIIQEIDAGRYVWPHIMDEVTRALPDYTWLLRLQQLAGTELVPEFQIIGRTGNTFALTRFMTDLEASPFIRSVRLTTTQQVRDGQGNVMHEFILMASYEVPPPELIETVPLISLEEE